MQYLSKNPERMEDIRAQMIATQQMERGNIEGAINTQQRRKQQQAEQLLQMSK